MTADFCSRIVICECKSNIFSPFYAVTDVKNIENVRLLIYFEYNFLCRMKIYS